MLNTLTQQVHEQTDQLFIGKRFYEATKAYCQKKGFIKTSAILLSGTVATVYSLAASYFCLEGVARSYSDVHHRNGTFEGMQGIGNTGEWSNLPILSAIAIGTLAMEFLYEGEYYKISSIAKKWLIKAKGDTENPQKIPLGIYDEMHHLLEDYRRRSLFTKELYPLRTLKIVKKASFDCQEKRYLQDVKLEKFLQSIQIELDEKISLSNHIQRIYMGMTADRLRGTTEKIQSIVGGIFLPLFFVYTGICSWVGEGPLAKVLFVNKENLSEVGHFGEWLMNAVQAMAIAAIFYKKCLLHEGDYVITKEIFASYLKKMASDPQFDADLYNRLCTIANEKLLQVSSSCAFKKLYGDYRFEKIIQKKGSKSELFMATESLSASQLAEDDVEVISQ